MISDHERNVINAFLPLSSAKKVDKLVRELKLSKSVVRRELFTEILFHIRKVDIQVYFKKCSEDWNIKRERVRGVRKKARVEKVAQEKYYEKKRKIQPTQQYKRQATRMWINRWKKSKRELQSLIPSKKDMELNAIAAKKVKSRIRKSTIQELKRKKTIRYSSISFREYDGDILHTK